MSTKVNIDKSTADFLRTALNGSNSPTLTWAVYHDLFRSLLDVELKAVNEQLKESVTASEADMLIDIQYSLNQVRDYLHE